MEALDDGGEFGEDLVGVLVVFHLSGDELGAGCVSSVGASRVDGWEGCLQVTQWLWGVEDLKRGLSVYFS